MENRIWLNKRKNKIVPEVRISTFILLAMVVVNLQASILDDLHGFLTSYTLIATPFMA